MKKHFILTSLFACAVIGNAQTKTLVPADLQTPGIRLEKIHEAAAQPSGDYDHGRATRGDCDKCKKSKKQGACNKPGKHYGKHKHRGGKGNCSNHNACCENRKNRGCDDNNRWSERNRRDRRDDGWGNDNNRDRRDDNNRRFSSTRQDRDSQYRGNSRSSQRRVAGTNQVRTNRPGTARRAGARPTVSRQ